MLVGVDAGNWMLKIFGEAGELALNSSLSEFRVLTNERELREHYDEEFIKWQFEGEQGFGGELALREGKYMRSRKGTTKAHKDLLIRVLIGLHRYSMLKADGEERFDIMVGQPIKSFLDDEIEMIKDILVGKHKFIINDDLKTINIKSVRVAPEGYAAFYATDIEQDGIVHMLDFGSGTVNACTMIDGKYSELQSFTVDRGMSHKAPEQEVKALMEAVIAECINHDWQKSEPVYIVGGGAKQAYQPLHAEFGKSAILNPCLKDGTPMGASYANAVGLYLLLKGMMMHV